MRVVKAVFFLLALFLISGCAAYKSVHFGEDYSPPTDIENVEILFCSPESEFVELGEVKVYGVTASNRSFMLQQLREMAAEMGGDGIVIEEREFPRYAPKPVAGIVIKRGKRDE